MEAILSLLSRAALSMVAFFVALGSLVTSGHVASAPLPQPFVMSTTTPASQETAASSTAMAGLISTSTTAAAQSAPSSANPPLATSPTTTSAAPAQSAGPSYPVEQLNSLARASIVNILCTTANGGSFNPISGSGVIVDSRGIILTNAHVAQYFLLRDFPTKNNIQCVIRVGSPAQPRYTAELMYLPPAWVDANAGDIASSTPTGTGENDYAFLRITGTTDPSGALPSSFPALPLDGANADEGQQMVLAAYPAGFLGGISIALNLYQTSAVATVGQLYAFSGENVDLFSLGGTVVSQAGSSGGAAVNAQGKLQGIIVTEVPAATTSGRDLRALSVGYINRSLAAAGMGGVTSLLSSDPASVESSFDANSAPKETQTLENVLTKQ